MSGRPGLVFLFYLDGIPAFFQAEFAVLLLARRGAGRDGEDAAIHAHVADLHLVGDAAEGDDAQFSNSNGGMTRSFSTVHGRSWTTKPRPARQSIRFTATRKRRAGVWP